MNKDQQQSIQEQRNALFQESNDVRLVAPCGINSGIIATEDLNCDTALDAYRDFQGQVSFFIPSSGSGSRMFHFLYEFLKTGVESSEVLMFFEHFENFVFFETMPLTVREKYTKLSKEALVEYLLSREGMNFGRIPKGLIPFHKDGQRIRTPFQEQFVQAKEICKNGGIVHFTIQKSFEESILNSLKELGKHRFQLSEVEFSEQLESTDAYCFDENQEPIIMEGDYLRRPAGHGALLNNLNDFDAEIVLIKNIDNVQPLEKSQDTDYYWKVVTGYLLNFKRDLLMLSEDFSQENLRELNKKYQLLSEFQENSFTEDDIKELMRKPSRVCGMVKNEGAPGGGPFWVDNDGVISKQIVEKSQISRVAHQQEILEGSSHFNPVFIAVSNQDSLGRKVDLLEFVDNSKFLKVKKPHEGTQIHYRELPGLWNGSMANWNTIFLELPSTVFSPVKSALDLLKFPHK